MFDFPACIRIFYFFNFTMMERTYGSPIMGNKSPFTPRSRQTINTRRSTSGLLSPALRKSSRFSVSGRSTQSVQIILKTPYNCVERFGQPLPVLITEALTFADRSAIVTAKISENGYAWVVCGRRLLVWQYRQSPTVSISTPQRKQALLNQSFELHLPQSDLAHRAELVSVFFSSGSHTPSCIAVSPEGVVRYWPAVAHESVSVEQSVDLHGQECDSLTDIEGLGCILATTTCTVVLVQPQLVGGRHLLNCHTLRTPSGWLGGISKRMSSLIFGPISAEQNSETRLVRVLSVPTHDDTWIVYVLAGHSLQKWKLAKQQPEQLIFIVELNRLVRDGFYSTVWENCGGDQIEIDTFLLDIQSDKDNIIILAAAVNMHVSPQIHYAMISLQTNTSVPPNNINDFLLLKVSGLYREDNPSDTLSYRFLLSGTNAYLYNQRSITVIKPQEEPDTLEFNSPEDFLLGGSVCVNTPIFFSRNNGLVAVVNNDLGSDLNISLNTTAQLESTLKDPSTCTNLSLYSMDPDEICGAYKNTVGQLKAAFIFHIKHQQQACQEILNELFFSEGASMPGLDSVLDQVVVKICEDLLDDVPAGDPRWTRDTLAGLGSSYSMQIQHQLEDKQKAHLLFMKFLQGTGLWDRLTACTIRDTPLATVHILGELAEKLVAALSLKNLKTTVLMDEMYEKAIEDSDFNTENGLSNQDIFYREVTKIYRGFQVLSEKCDSVAHSDLNPSQIALIIAEANEIILSVLKDVIQYRQENAENFTPSKTATSIAPDYIPWISANGPEGLYESLILQQSLTFNYGTQITGDYNLASTLYDQFVNLIDIILDGRKCHIESIRRTDRENVLIKQYQNDRHKLIKPLVDKKQWERAAVLAEKYLDFETLVLICELTDNQQRLDEYMERFSDEGFPRYVYNWYLQQNKQGKLIDRYRKTKQTEKAQQLTNFLTDHPTLSWMQNIYDKNFDMAADILKSLANEETESLKKQKTMLSLCKLAKLASPETDDSEMYIDNVNSHLDLVAYQEQLPDYVLQEFGYDTNNPGVIPPKDLICLYICPEYKEATEMEFKKALDLLNFVQNDEIRDNLSLKIWRAAILRDNWNYKNLEAPIEIIQNTLVFRLVDLSFRLGCNVQNLLPPFENLLEDASMPHLEDNKCFEFLMKTGYEYVYKTYCL